MRGRHLTEPELLLIFRCRANGDRVDWIARRMGLWPSRVRRIIADNPEAIAKARIEITPRADTITRTMYVWPTGGGNVATEKAVTLPRLRWLERS